MREPLTLPRRKFLAGGLALLAAPAIVRASSLMQIKPEREPFVQGMMYTFHGPRDPLRNAHLTINGQTLVVENIELRPGAVYAIGYDMQNNRWVSINSIPERQPGA